MRFRKRPVEIEAFSFSKDQMFNWRTGGIDRWPAWARKALGTRPGTEGAIWRGEMRDGVITVYCGTLEGRHEVSDGDWIIRGVKGEIYPCKPDVFEMTYEAA